MVGKAKQAFFLLVYYLSPIVASIIYWFEEPEPFSLDSLVHRTGSIIGIFAFIFVCFNVIINIKIKLIEKNFSLDGIIRFHKWMAGIALILGSIHYPLVRIGRTFSQIQIRTGSFGWIVFLTLMALAITFMSNQFIKYQIIKKIRTWGYKIKFRYNINKALHNLMMIGVIFIFIHSFIAFTSSSSILMRSVYSFFFIITFIGWIYHKLIRRFRSESDPYLYRKASWDVDISEIIPEKNKEWALTLIKQNPSIYACLQCGTCTNNCPVSEVTKGGYNPRRNILAARFGYKDLVLGGEKLVIWGCTMCHTCDEVCPQNIELTDTFTFLKNQSITQGKGPDFVYEEIKALFENAKAIPLQPEIERRRGELGLPIAVKPEVNEVKTLLRNLGVDRKLKLNL
ncbi:MAG: 4Fe-4S dicluster domain-containing protein [Candidatus Hodarchaeota archaeon]